MRRSLITIVALVAGAIAVRAQQADSLKRLMDGPPVKAALAAVKTEEPRTIRDQIRFCEIPAPEFKEHERGKELQRVFQEIGLDNVHVDKAGNVLGSYAGAAARPHLVIAAHLDTVFPEGTDVKVKQEGAILHGPGIGDDCRGLAVLVAIARE
ncbi:MAG TPA: M28 family peptidase, partial [Vicinamibacterales bacterium]|nr:M28 family peptidase [Vicinamibacterales bacterium]